MRKIPTFLDKLNALDDIWAFADLINYRGGKVGFSQFHFELTDFLCQPQKIEDVAIRRRLILASRGHFKSSVCSVLYVMWRIYRNPDIRVLVAANLKRLSKAFIRELRQYFEDKWLQDNVWNKRPHIEGVLVPALSAADRRKRNATRNDEDTEATDSKLIWSMEALQVIRPTYVKEPTVQTVSIGTTVTGDHYDLLILDDIVDFSNSDTENKAEQILDWTRDLESVLDPRLEHCYEYMDGKQARTFTDFTGDESVTLGTRYFQWDYYGYLLENAELLGHCSFVRNVYVNGEDDTEGYTFPERFTQEVVENIKRRLNSFRRFASQYLNRIVSNDEQLLLRENIQYFMINGCDIAEDGYVVINSGLGKRVRVKPMLVVDPAVSQKATADNTVLTVGGYDDNKELYVFDMRAGRFVPSETIRHIFELAAKWHLNAVTVETVGGFGLLAPIIKDNFVKYNKILAVREYKPKGEKKARILTHLEPQWENKTIHMSNVLALMTVLNDELDAFPLGKDDCVDTISIICELCTPTRKEGSKRAFTPRKTTNSRYGGVR